MSYLADQLKEQGNIAFRNGEFVEAEDYYTQAIQKYSRNPLIFTNRANVRLKLQRWDGVVNDCLKSIEITGANGQNHKAFYFLGKAEYQPPPSVSRNLFPGTWMLYESLY